MEDYKATVAESSKQLTNKEKVMLKDTTNATQLDSIPADEFLVIEPDYYGVIKVHNEHSQDKDYVKYVVVDKSGDKYVTGSESFWRAFTSIVEEMEDSDEDYAVKVYKMESKKYSGKYFITCAIV